MELGPGLRWAVETCRADIDGPALKFSHGEPAAWHELVEFVSAEAHTGDAAAGVFRAPMRSSSVENGSPEDTQGCFCARSSKIVQSEPVLRF